MKIRMPRLVPLLLLLLASAGLSACGGSGSGDSGNHIVGTLTGDDDSEVTPALQDLVLNAVQLTEFDEPLPD